MVWITKEAEIEIRERVDEEADVPEWKKIHEIADEAVENLSTEYLSATENLRENVRVTALAEGFRNNNLNQVQREIDWNRYISSLAVLGLSLREIINRSGNEMKRHLPPEMRGFEFEVDNEIENWIDMRTSELSNHFVNSSRESFNFAMRDINNEDIGDSRKARFLLPLIGLTTRQVIAVNNYRRNLIAEGVAFDRVQTLTENYANESLLYRAERMGKNESMLSANHGYMAMVFLGIKAGVIPRRVAKKRWIVTPDDRLCQFCEPLADVSIPVNEMFSTAYGLMEEPPMHIHCRCSFEIIFET